MTNISDITIELVERAGKQPYYDVTWKENGEIRFELFRLSACTIEIEELKKEAIAFARNLKEFGGTRRTKVEF